MANAKPDAPRALQGQGGRNFNMTPEMRARQALLARQMGDFYNKEKPALVLSLNPRGQRRHLICAQNGGSYVKRCRK